MKHKVVLTTVILATLGVASTYIVVDKTSYDEDVTSVRDLTFSVVQMDRDHKRFLNEVTSSWTVSKVIPADFMSVPLSTVGYANTITGLIDFCTHTPKPYSVFDRGRNKQEIKKSYTLHSHLTTSVDRCLYLGNDVAYHKLAVGTVEVYVNTDEGLKVTQYNKN